MTISNLIIEMFLLLREKFFQDNMQPIPFYLRDKRNTQDDPLDEYISNILADGFKDAKCLRSPGPLISPDFVLYRPDRCEGETNATLKDDLSRIVAIEVKKLERSNRGHVARMTGLDYNTTPPCGKVRVYAASDKPLDIRGFYLFVVQEKVDISKYFLSSLVLCDGNILNEDFDLYLSIISQREKEIGLGTFGNGANRNRPMLIFANPLGSPQLDRNATLIIEQISDSRLKLAYNIERKTKNDDKRVFYAYRKKNDISTEWQVQTLNDPFPQPQKRVSITQSRGRFRIPLQIE
jgi:hypothetical protein